jgi:hypothetical protein
MVDISAIAGALSALKAANDIAQAMIGLRDAAAFQTKLIEFQSKIIEANNSAFAAQEERAALLQQISDLEKQVASFKAWETEKQRYELKDSGGTFTYVLKPDAQGSEPSHKICAACYQHSKKSILQIVPGNNVRTAMGIRTIYRCPECKSEFAA